MDYSSLPQVFLDHLCLDSEKLLILKNSSSGTLGVYALFCVYAACQLQVSLKKLPTIFFAFVLDLKGYFWSFKNYTHIKDSLPVKMSNNTEV